MNTRLINACFTTRITHLFTYLLLAATISLLSACGGDDAPANPSTSGIYKNGTLTLDGGTTPIQTDLRGFVHNNRLIMFSIAGHVLFDGQLSAVVGSGYTGTVNVYESGIKTQSNVTVTGTVTSRSLITGTFGITGDGVASGGFSLTFDAAYNTAATVARLRGASQTDWDGDLLTTFSLVGDTTNKDRVRVSSSSGSDTITASAINDSNPAIKVCTFQGVYSIAAVNVYVLAQNLLSTNSDNANCDFPLDPAVQYTGFASVLSESATDSDLLYAITNGDYAVFGLVVKQIPIVAKF